MRKRKCYFGFARKERHFPRFVTWGGVFHLKAGGFILLNVFSSDRVYADIDVVSMYRNLRKKKPCLDFMCGKHRHGTVDSVSITRGCGNLAWSGDYVLSMWETPAPVVSTADDWDSL